jgi:hypothetical protein
MSKVIVNKANGEIFKHDNFMGVPVLVRELDGYVNASKITPVKEWENNEGTLEDFLDGDRFNQICEYWRNLPHNTKLKKPPVAKYILGGVFDEELKGTYVHPDLVHFVARWVDPEYAFIEMDVMKGLDRQFHEKLTRLGLPDTPENVAKVMMCMSGITLAKKGE